MGLGQLATVGSGRQKGRGQLRQGRAYSGKTQRQDLAEAKGTCGHKVGNKTVTGKGAVLGACYGKINF